MVQGCPFLVIAGAGSSPVPGRSQSGLFFWLQRSDGINADADSEQHGTAFGQPGDRLALNSDMVMESTARAFAVKLQPFACETEARAWLLQR